MLRGNGIKKSFQSESLNIPVLRGIDMEIEEGEFVCIMGKSGSGKSTLLNILSTLDGSDEGEVVFEGRKLEKLSDDEKSKLRREEFGFVFQMPRMVKTLSILDNILLPSVEYAENKEAAAKKANALMKKVGIEELSGKRISEVSGGQLQRAGICRALINNPKIIFADEPTGALDSKTGREVLDLFAGLYKEGRSILMVTHDVNVAAASRRVLFMKDGLLYKDVRLGDDEAKNAAILREEIERL